MDVKDITIEEILRRYDESINFDELDLLETLDDEEVKEFEEAKEFNDLYINPKFEELFRDDMDQKMYYQVYGGRGSAKSTSVAIAMVELTYSEHDHKILYLRQTMTSIEDSSITDIRSAIKMLGAESDFVEKKGRITNRTTGNFITFKGLRSNGSAKANLKSLSGFTTVVFEEAEEIESFEQFSKVDEGIRKMGVPLKVIMIYNPTSSLSSWIHKEWFIDGQPNPERFHDTCFIHSTFEDNIENLHPKKVKRYRDLKITNPVYYKNVILAEWTLSAQDRIYPDWAHYRHILKEIGDEWYGLDFSYGGGDSTALIKINWIDGRYYVKTLFEEPQQLVRHTIKNMKKHKVPMDAKIYADHFPLLINEIREAGWRRIEKTYKPKVEEGVKLVQDLDIHIVGGEEDPLYYASKTWSRTDGKIKDHEPDCLAGLRYGLISHKPSRFNMPGAQLPPRQQMKKRSGWDQGQGKPQGGFRGTGGKGYV